MQITNDEWMEISYELEQHHAVFYKVWQMGKPLFDESIPTACVQFDKQGNFVVFRFNPEFWKSLDLKNKLFVICHEALHIVLNHGARAKDANINHAAANAAMDIVVNHLLARSFGFVRSEITNGENYCWVDTVFRDKKPMPLDNMSFEHYYNLFDKFYGDGKPDGSNGAPVTVDDHQGLGSTSWKEVIEELNDSLSDEEKEGLKTTIQKHFQSDEKQDASQSLNSMLNSKAGFGTGGIWTFVNGKKKKKHKWETIIKKWAIKQIKFDDHEVEQWVRENRRMNTLSRSLMLPSDYEVHDRCQNENKIDVWFYLDTSGSCWNLKDRFFNAAESLPEHRFKVRLFCFDTQVVETTLESKKVYGGGGTCFKIIENSINATIAKESCKYPSAVWIITDGYGTMVNPLHPDRWNWFLTEGGARNYIPKKSQIFDLKDFE